MEPDKYDEQVDALFYAYEKRLWPTLFAAALRAQGVEIERLQAVFQSIATNSKAYEGLLGAGQALIDKDAEIERLKAELADAVDRLA